MRKGALKRILSKEKMDRMYKRGRFGAAIMTMIMHDDEISY